jgi:hypothetical protein
LRELVEQGDYLWNVEGEALGLEAALKVGHIREEYWAKSRNFGHRRGSPNTPLTVESEFHDELTPSARVRIA